MLKSCGRKLLLSLVGSMFTCLLVLMVEPPGRPGLARGEAGGAQRALQSLGVAVAPPAAQGPPGLRSFADYFGRLSRARRELPAAPPSAPRPPAEDISPRDVFIAVKTTKKFHKARLELLLDTWISRNRDMVRGWGRSLRQPGWSGAGRAAVRGCQLRSRPFAVRGPCVLCPGKCSFLFLLPLCRWVEVLFGGCPGCSAASGVF